VGPQTHVNLYLLSFLGEPSLLHPAFYQAGTSGLKVLLFANSEEEAERLAREFAVLIRIEVQALHRFYLIPQPDGLNHLPEWGRRILTDGFAFIVFHLAVGQDLPSEEELGA
jgi:hypothetical protein